VPESRPHVVNDLHASRPIAPGHFARAPETVPEEPDLAVPNAYRERARGRR